MCVLCVSSPLAIGTLFLGTLLLPRKTGFLSGASTSHRWSMFLLFFHLSWSCPKSAFKTLFLRTADFEEPNTSASVHCCVYLVLTLSACSPTWRHRFCDVVYDHPSVSGLRADLSKLIVQDGSQSSLLWTGRLLDTIKAANRWHHEVRTGNYGTVCLTDPVFSAVGACATHRC
ncbi:hypothetical protein C8R43DRAFT_1030303 [Mycena crocata]|nr:hypothetical protein C8R43DRAFT_1030303 [Mycena crocata]